MSASGRITGDGNGTTWKKWTSSPAEQVVCCITYLGKDWMSKGQPTYNAVPVPALPPASFCGQPAALFADAGCL